MFRSLAVLFCLAPATLNAEVLFAHKELGYILDGTWVAKTECPLGTGTIKGQRVYKFEAKLLSPEYSGTYQDLLGRSGKIEGTLYGTHFSHRDTIGGYSVIAQGDFHENGNEIVWFDNDGCRVHAKRN